MAELGLWRIAAAQPDRPTLVDPDHRTRTAGELAAASNRLVHALRGLGFEAGDVLATLVPNGVTYVETLLACQQAGWHLVPINHHLAGAEVAYIVEDAGAKAFVADAGFADLLAATVPHLALDASRRFVVGDAVAGFASLDDLVADQPDTLPDDRRAGGIMTYTSGTTGKPKGVRRPLPPLDPDEQAMRSTFLNGLFGLTDPDHVHLVVAPLYHTAVVNFAQAALHAGHQLVLMDRWTPQGTLERIERYGVTSTHMVPTMFTRLLKLPAEVRDAADVSSLRCAIHSAAPCPVELKRAMLDWWGPVIYEYYAATEGGGTIATPQDWLRKPGTVGTAWPISEVVVLGDDGDELAAGEVGTVWMRMGEHRFEYKDDPDKTRDAWNDRGFFTVGDVGELDEDGFLFLRDRAVDVIISGGVNIYPAEIEAVLLAHPAVLDAAVFGVPDEDFGEAVKAAVEVVDGIEPGPALEAELLAHCRAHLGGYKVPRSVDVPEVFPRDPNGKVYKRRLRDPYWADRASALV